MTSRHPRPLGAYDAYLFDVDGTLVSAQGAIPGAAETLNALKECEKRVLAVTNSSSLARQQVAERFLQLSLPLGEDDVFSALTATAQLIAREQPGARVHVFGHASLSAELERHGLTTTDEDDADYVVVGNNHGATYEWLTRAMRALLRGARFVAVNADRMYVGEDGLVPGAGAWVAALERTAGRGPDVIVGKPSVTILREAAESIGYPPSACLYVGDNPESDVAGAHAAGMDALLVLSGVATTTDECLEAPEHVLPSVADLRRYLVTA